MTVRDPNVFLGYVYQIKNQVDGKVYIGKTQDPIKRWCDHRSSAKLNPLYPLHAAMAQCGLENFTFEILEVCSSKEEMKYLEGLFCDIKNSCHPGYGYNINKPTDINKKIPEKKLRTFGKGETIDAEGNIFFLPEAKRNKRRNKRSQQHS